MSDVLKTIHEKKLIIRFVIFCASLFASALVFNLFFSPTNITPGGSSGLSIIIHEITGIDKSTLVTITYIITLLLSFIFLDLEKSISLILCTFIYPFFVKITSDITRYIVIDYTDMPIICLIAGFLNGATTGLCFKMGFNPGGLSVIAQIVYKYFKISISKVNLFMSAIIVLMSGYYFGINHILYAIIVIYITSVATDKVLLGISKNKYIYIVTDKEESVHNFIVNNLKHGVTKLSCENGLGRKRYVLMTSIPTRDYTLLKEGVKMIDNEVFLVATDAYQSYGGI